MFSVYPLLAALRQQRNHMGGVASFEPRNVKQRALVRAFDLEHERVAELLGVQSMITDDQEMYRAFIAMHAIRFPGIDSSVVTIPRGKLGVAGVLDLDIVANGQLDTKFSGGGVQYVCIDDVYFSSTQFADAPIATFRWAGNKVSVIPLDGVERFDETDAEAQRQMVDLIASESKSVRKSKRDRGRTRRLRMPKLFCSIAHNLDWMLGFKVLDESGLSNEVSRAFCGISLQVRACLGEQTMALDVKPYETFSGSLLLWVERSTLEEPVVTAVLYPQDSRVKTQET